jgi:hypothetical protein
MAKLQLIGVHIEISSLNARNWEEQRTSQTCFPDLIANGRPRTTSFVKKPLIRGHRFYAEPGPERLKSAALVVTSSSTSATPTATATAVRGSTTATAAARYVARRRRARCAEVAAG